MKGELLQLTLLKLIKTCDTENSIVVDHAKNDPKKSMVTNFTIICRKSQDKESIASLMRVPKMRVIMHILSSNNKFHALQKNLRSP